MRLHEPSDKFYYYINESKSTLNPDYHLRVAISEIRLHRDKVVSMFINESCEKPTILPNILTILQTFGLLNEELRILRNSNISLKVPKSYQDEYEEIKGLICQLIQEPVKRQISSSRKKVEDKDKQIRKKGNRNAMSHSMEIFDRQDEFGLYENFYDQRQILGKRERFKKCSSVQTLRYKSQKKSEIQNQIEKKKYHKKDFERNISPKITQILFPPSEIRRRRPLGIFRNLRKQALLETHEDQSSKSLKEEAIKAEEKELSRANRSMLRRIAAPPTSVSQWTRNWFGKNSEIDSWKSTRLHPNLSQTKFSHFLGKLNRRKLIRSPDSQSQSTRFAKKSFCVKTIQSRIAFGLEHRLKKTLSLRSLGNRKKMLEETDPSVIPLQSHQLRELTCSFVQRESDRKKSFITVPQKCEELLNSELSGGWSIYNETKTVKSMVTEPGGYENPQPATLSESGPQSQYGLAYADDTEFLRDLELIKDCDQDMYLGFLKDHLDYYEFLGEPEALELMNHNFEKKKFNIGGVDLGYRKNENYYVPFNNHGKRKRKGSVLSKKKANKKIVKEKNSKLLNENKNLKKKKSADIQKDLTQMKNIKQSKNNKNEIIKDENSIPQNLKINSERVPLLNAKKEPNSEISDLSNNPKKSKNCQKVSKPLKSIKTQKLENIVEKFETENETAAETQTETTKETNTAKEETQKSDSNFESTKINQKILSKKANLKNQNQKKSKNKKSVDSIQKNIFSENSDVNKNQNQKNGNKNNLKKSMNKKNQKLPKKKSIKIKEKRMNNFENAESSDIKEIQNIETLQLKKVKTENKANSPEKLANTQNLDNNMQNQTLETSPKPVKKRKRKRKRRKKKKKKKKEKEKEPESSHPKPIERPLILTKQAENLTLGHSNEKFSSQVIKQKSQKIAQNFSSKISKMPNFSQLMQLAQSNALERRKDSSKIDFGQALLTSNTLQAESQQETEKSEHIIKTLQQSPLAANNLDGSKIKALGQLLDATSKLGSGKATNSRRSEVQEYTKRGREQDISNIAANMRKISISRKSKNTNEGVYSNENGSWKRLSLSREISRKSFMKWFKEVKCSSNASEEERQRLLKETFEEYSRQNPKPDSSINSEERQIEIALARNYQAKKKLERLQKKDEKIKDKSKPQNQQITSKQKTKPQNPKTWTQTDPKAKIQSVPSIQNRKLGYTPNNLQNLQQIYREHPQSNNSDASDNLSQDEWDEFTENSPRKKRQSVLLAPFFLTKDLDLGSLSGFMDDLDGKEKFAQAELIFLQRSKHLHKIVIIDPNLR